MPQSPCQNLKINPESLQAALARQLGPIYLISGDEPLLVGEARDLILESARERGFAERELVVAEQGFSWDDLFASTQSLGLFAEQRLIDIRLPTGKPGDKGSKIITALAESPPELTVILISVPKLSGSAVNAKWVKAIDAAGALVRIWPLEARHLPAWIERRMQRAGLSAEREAILQMARRVEGNLLAAQQEIDKLALLYPGKTVTETEVESAMGDSARYDVFLLADEALSGRAKRALRMLANLKAEGVVPVLVLWSLIREVRQLASIADAMAQGASFASAAGAARVWKTRQGLVHEALRRHQGASLDALLELGARADAAAKGRSSDDPWQLLTELVFWLATGDRLMAVA